MIDGIEQYYQRLAEALADSIVEPWSLIVLDAFYFTEGNVFEADYLREADGVGVSMQVPSSAIDAIGELRERFAESNQPIWGQLYFQLTSDGDFNMKWGYDNCDEHGDTVYDAEWLELKRKDRQTRLAAR